MPKVVAIVGLTGAGKSEAVKFYTDRSFHCVYFGALTIETLKEEGRDVTPENEKEVRERLRREHGMAAFAILNVPKIKDALADNKDVVIDGLYSWEEYLILKDAYPEMVTVAVYAPPALRYERLSKRTVRPLTPEQAKDRDVAEIENSHKAGPIAIADYTVINTGTLEELNSALESTLVRV